MKVQNVLISGLLEPIASLVGGFDPKMRKVLSVASLLGLVALFMYAGSSAFSVRYAVVLATGFAFLGLLVLSNMEKGISTVKWDKFLSICWLAICGLMLYSSFANNLDYLFDPLVFMLAPIAFIVWNHFGYERFAKLLVRATIISFAGYVVISALFFPIDTIRYSGLIANPNGAAEYHIVVAACILIEIFNIKKINLKALLLYTLMGFDITLLFYTMSRTGEVAAIICLVVMLVAYIFNHIKELKRIITHCILPIIISIAILLPTTLYIFRFCHVSGLNFANNNVTINEIFSVSEKRIETGGKTVDGYLSGRASIWKVFSEHIKLFGNGEKEAFFVPARNQVYPTAHNMFLEYAFRYGYVCAAIFLLYVVWSGIKSLIFAFKKGSNAYSPLPMAMAILFFGESMVASLNDVFVHFVTLSYLLVQFPLIIKQQNREVGRD